MPASSRLNSIPAARAQHHSRARDDDNFAFDIIALYSLIPDSSSTAGQLHQFFRIPGPSHRDFCGSLCDFAKIVRD